MSGFRPPSKFVGRQNNFNQQQPRAVGFGHSYQDRKRNEIMAQSDNDNKQQQNQHPSFRTEILQQRENYQRQQAQHQLDDEMVEASRSLFNQLKGDKIKLDAAAAEWMHYEWNFVKFLSSLRSDLHNLFVLLPAPANTLNRKYTFVPTKRFVLEFSNSHLQYSALSAFNRSKFDMRQCKYGILVDEYAHVCKVDPVDWEAVFYVKNSNKVELPHIKLFNKVVVSPEHYLHPINNNREQQQQQQQQRVGDEYSMGPEEWIQELVDNQNKNPTERSPSIQYEDEEEIPLTDNNNNNNNSIQPDSSSDLRIPEEKATAVVLVSEKILEEQKDIPQQTQSSTTTTSAAAETIPPSFKVTPEEFEYFSTSTKAEQQQFFIEKLDRMNSSKRNSFFENNEELVLRLQDFGIQFGEYDNVENAQNNNNNSNNSFFSSFHDKKTQAIEATSSALRRTRESQAVSAQQLVDKASKNKERRIYAVSIRTKKPDSQKPVIKKDSKTIQQNKKTHPLGIEDKSATHPTYYRRINRGDYTEVVELVSQVEQNNTLQIVQQALISCRNEILEGNDSLYINKYDDEAALQKIDLMAEIAVHDDDDDFEDIHTTRNRQIRNQTKNQNTASAAAASSSSPQQQQQRQQQELNTDKENTSSDDSSDDDNNNNNNNNNNNITEYKKTFALLPTSKKPWEKFTIPERLALHEALKLCDVTPYCPECGISYYVLKEDMVLWVQEHLFNGYKVNLNFEIFYYNGMKKQIGNHLLGVDDTTDMRPGLRIRDRITSCTVISEEKRNYYATHSDELDRVLGKGKHRFYGRTGEHDPEDLVPKNLQSDVSFDGRIVIGGVERRCCPFCFMFVNVFSLQIRGLEAKGGVINDSQYVFAYKFHLETHEEIDEETGEMIKIVRCPAISSGSVTLPENYLYNIGHKNMDMKVQKIRASQLKNREQQIAEKAAANPDAILTVPHVCCDLIMASTSCKYQDGSINVDKVRSYLFGHSLQRDVEGKEFICCWQYRGDRYNSAEIERIKKLIKEKYPPSEAVERSEKEIKEHGLAPIHYECHITLAVPFSDSNRNGQICHIDLNGIDSFFAEILRNQPETINSLWVPRCANLVDSDCIPYRTSRGLNTRNHKEKLENNFGKNYVITRLSQARYIVISTFRLWQKLMNKDKQLKCFCGMPLFVHASHCEPGQPSEDRVDNTSNHFNMRMVIACTNCNMARRAIPYDEWIAFMRNLLTAAKAKCNDTSPLPEVPPIIFDFLSENGWCVDLIEFLKEEKTIFRD